MNAIKIDKGSGHTGKIIKADDIAIFEPHAVGSTQAAVAPTERRVRLIKDGDVVKTIEVRCTCGEVIQLDCEY